jgi:hypothetical protein
MLRGKDSNSPVKFSIGMGQPAAVRKDSKDSDSGSVDKQSGPKSTIPENLARNIDIESERAINLRALGQRNPFTWQVDSTK